MFCIFALPAFAAALLLTIFGFALGQAWPQGWGLSIGQTCTVTIAVMAFFTTIYQVYATRKHNRILVKPRLMFNSYFKSEKDTDCYEYGLIVKNVGFGPAIIKKYTVTLCGVVLDNHNDVH